MKGEPYYKRAASKSNSVYLKPRPWTQLGYAAMYIKKLEDHALKQGDALSHLRKLVYYLEEGNPEKIQNQMDRCRHLLRQRKARHHYPPEFKFEVLRMMETVKAGKRTQVLKRFRVSYSSYVNWKRKYDEGGIDALAGYDKASPPNRAILAAQLTYKEFKDKEAQALAEEKLRKELKSRKVKTKLRNPDATAEQVIQTRQEEVYGEEPAPALSEDEKKWTALF